MFEHALQCVRESSPQARAGVFTLELDGVCAEGTAASEHVDGTLSHELSAARAETEKQSVLDLLLAPAQGLQQDPARLDANGI